MSIASRITSIEEHIENAYNKLEDLGVNLYKLPEGYTQLDYIESTGTQYIDTGYIPVQGDNFEFKNVTSNVSENLGTLFSAGTEDYQLVFLINESGKTSFYKYFATGAAQSFITPTINKSNIKIVNGGLYIDGTLKSTSTYAGTVNTTLYLGRRANTASPLNGSFGEVIITNGGTIKRDLIPCKNSSNVIGMYDLVTKTFLTNSGTGTFTAGETSRETIDKNIDNIATKLEQVYEEYPKVTASNVTEASLNGTKKGKMEIDIKGNTTQESDPTPETPIPIKSCGDNVNEWNGTFTNSSANNLRCDIENFKRGTYTISFDISSSTNQYQTTIKKVVEGTATTIATNYNTNNLTFTLDEDATLRAEIYRIGILPENVTNIKLEQGTQPTPYSPYGCGNVNVKVSNKNWLINNKTTGTSNGITYTVNEDKSITMSGTASSQSNFYLFGTATDYVDLGIPAGNYVFSGITGGSTSTFINYLIKKDKDGNTSTYTQTTESKAVTINEGDTFRVFLRVISGYAFGDNPVTAYPQIELGSTATSYVPHAEQNLSFPLAQGQKLMEGDYLADDGVHHKMKQDTVNGTTATFNDAKENGKYYCNQKVTGYLTGQTITFDTSVTNAIVQYQLAEEVIETYTQEQQTAYNQIKQAQSYLGQTNINSLDEVKPNMNLSALKGT